MPSCQVWLSKCQWKVAFHNRFIFWHKGYCCILDNNVKRTANQMYSCWLRITWTKAGLIPSSMHSSVAVSVLCSPFLSVFSSLYFKRNGKRGACWEFSWTLMELHLPCGNVNVSDALLVCGNCDSALDPLSTLQAMPCGKDRGLPRWRPYVFFEWVPGRKLDVRVVTHYCSESRIKETKRWGTAAWHRGGVQEGRQEAAGMIQIFRSLHRKCHIFY